jgi:hypothetical protein
MSNNLEREIMNRMVRIESKLVRGFEELGVNIDKDNAWLSVDDVQRMVFVSTLGRSLTVILSDMARQGATQLGKTYEIMYRNTNVGSVVFRPIT